MVWSISVYHLSTFENQRKISSFLLFLGTSCILLVSLTCNFLAEPVEVTTEPVEVTTESVEVKTEPVEVTTEPVEVKSVPVLELQMWFLLFRTGTISSFLKAISI